MRKNLLKLMAMVLGLFLMAGPVMAADVADIDTTIGGDVGLCARWDLSTPNISAKLGEITAAMYDTGVIELGNLAQITNLDSNSPFKITATQNGWTDLPANYAGAKKSDGTDSDVELIIENVIPGYATASEGLVAKGTYGSAYTAVTKTESDILQVGTVNHGVQNAACDIKARVKMDWATDIAGTYTTSLTLSISQTL